MTDCDGGCGPEHHTGYHMYEPTIPKAHRNCVGRTSDCSWATTERTKPVKVVVEPLTPAQEYWHKKYQEQREMERQTSWIFCPWCAAKLAVMPLAHICGEPDVD